MIEKWVGYKSYLTKELYLHYILVQNNFDENKLNGHEDFSKNKYNC